MELYVIFISFSLFLCTSPKFCNEHKLCIFLENKHYLKKTLCDLKIGCYWAVSALTFLGGDYELPSIKFFCF